MSAIRERTVLSIIDLPKKLLRRKNLRAHFSKFGEITDLVVDKELRSVVIQFSTHFDAQAAKTQGKVFEGEPLNIFWSKMISLDPRAKKLKIDKESDSGSTETLWDDNDEDKETFGVVRVQTERKKPAQQLINQHLKGNVKKRIGLIKPGDGNKTKSLASLKSPTKIGGKVAVKTLATLKKSVLAQGNKRKLVRKESALSINKPKKSTSYEDQSPKSVISMSEKADLKMKLALLDERDKLIRTKIIPDSNIKTAVAMKGTCPDMCPEKERIMRQYSLSVAAYEMIPGTYDMDENKAVKEYTRSSADQEVPLPHDVRPEPVLSMTMDYLITKIISKIDSPNENKAVWYSFCWNRLRSIRKDIILQQLCSMETVKIVEQCARFHIACYDHMWEAEVAGFDDKINTLNLMDCLQTLRHMYEDLAKHGITSPNEPEFYSYLILLKLNSGDVMWEYQQYSLEIQLSSEVQFAIQAYIAFENNKYSTFFSLVKKASYLTSCLMQRYFDEVRTKALKIMLKAYCLPGKTIGLSSSFVVSSLKFDSLTNAQVFCEKDEVELKIDSKKTNDQEQCNSASSFLVREKRLPIANAVVGENSPLPVYIPHEVNSTFDEFGQLKHSSSLVMEEGDDVSDVVDETSFPKQDNSAVSGPEVLSQQPTFKFSLSPTNVMPTNYFGKSLFSSENNQKRNNNDIKEKQTESVVSNFQNTSNFFFGSQTDQMDNADLEGEDLEEDFDQEIKYGDSQTKVERPVDSHQSILTQKTLQSFELYSHETWVQNQFFIQPNTSPVVGTSVKSITGQNKEHNVPFFSQENSIPKRSISISFTNVENNQSLSDENSQHKYDNSFSLDKLKEFNNKLNYAEKQTSSGYENLKISETVDDLHSMQNKLKQQTQIVLEEESKDQLLKGVKTESSSYLSDKLLKEKAEKENLMREEKLKLEEIERIAAEKHRKKIEEQKMYQSLRKYVGKRLKADNARKFARQWKMKVEKLKERRADFPRLIHLSVNTHLEVWGTVNSLPTTSVLQRTKGRRILTSATSQLLRSGITNSCTYIGSYLAETLAKSAAKHTGKGDVKPLFWKLGVSVPFSSNPSPELSVFNQLMKRWCRRTFYKRSSSQLGSTETIFTNIKVPVSISVHFYDDCQSSCNLQGMDALIFVVVNKTESENMCLQRLVSLISSQSKSKDFSVAVMNVGGAKLGRTFKVELEELDEQNLIGHWIVKDWTNHNSIMESLEFLAEHITIAPEIRAIPLELLMKQTCEEFFDALSSGQHLSVGLMEALKNPNNIISLYNTCLTKLEDVLISSKLEKYFNLAKEFKMCIPPGETGGPELLCGKQYDEAYKSQLSQEIISLKLKDFQKWPPKTSSDLLKSLKTFCFDVHDVNIFPQIVRMLDLPDDLNLSEYLQQVSWLNIVELWAQCSIRSFLTNKERNKQLLVIYNKNDVHRLITNQWWLKLPMVASLDK